MHQLLREELAKAKTLEGVAAVSQELKLRCQACAVSGMCRARSRPVPPGLAGDGDPGLLQEDMSRQEGEEPSGGLPFFHWICQPYFRPG